MRTSESSMSIDENFQDKLTFKESIPTNQSGLGMSFVTSDNKV